MDYAGNFIYENTKLSFILTDEGRLVPDSSGFEYEYFIKDHLGNTRLTVKDSSGTATVMSEAHYYPFGLEINTLAFASPQQKTANRYLYNGKELQDDFALGWYDYGARFYDPIVPHFLTIDRFAEKYVSWSPYNYVINNPINFIDPTGDTTYYYANDGTYLGVTFDKLENGVSIISDVEKWTQSAFNQSVALARGNSRRNSEALTIDAYAEKQRGFGKTYMVNDLWNFYDKTEGDGVEHGTYLYENSKGEIRTGKENFIGNGIRTWFDEKFNNGNRGPQTIDDKPIYSLSKYGNEQTRAHTHPYAGQSTIMGKGGHNPSDTDLTNAPHKGMPNVVISKTQIYIYKRRFYQAFYRNPFKPKFQKNE